MVTALCGGRHGGRTEAPWERGGVFQGGVSVRRRKERVRGPVSLQRLPVAAVQGTGLRRRELPALGCHLGASLTFEGRIIPVLQMRKRKSIGPVGLYYRVRVFITVLCGQFKLNYNPVLDFVLILDFLVLLSDSRCFSFAAI